MTHEEKSAFNNRCERNPLKVGAAFLRHESKFYLYALYNKNKPKSDALMSEYGTSFFKVSQMLLHMCTRNPSSSSPGWGICVAATIQVVAQIQFHCCPLMFIWIRFSGDLLRVSHSIPLSLTHVLVLWGAVQTTRTQRQDGFGIVLTETGSANGKIRLVAATADEGLFWNPGT